MAVTSVEAPDTAARPTPPGRARPVAIVIAVAVALPLLVLAVRAIRTHWLPFSDWALIELRTRDVGTAHTPLVGPYSRYGWNHPGPLLYYAFAPFYRLVGAQAKGILLGALAVNTASVAAICAVCWRRGRVVGLLVGAAVTLVLARALHPDFLVHPWNPYVIVLPMLAVFVLCWASVEGDARWALPVAIGAGSFAIQTHVGATLGVVVPIAIALVYLVLDARVTKQWIALRTTVIIAAVVGVVGWIAPIVQQLHPDAGTKGNLGELWSFWTSSHPNVSGWSTGARIAGAQLAIPAPWFTGHEVRSGFTGGVYPGWHVPLALFLLVGALVVAARRHDNQSTRLCVLALGLVGAAWVSASRIVDTPFYYVTQWIWIVGAAVWLAIAWTAVRALRAPRAVEAVAGVGVAVLVIVLVVGAVRASFPNPGNDERSLEAFAPAARTALRALPGPVLVDNAGDLRSRTMSDGVLALGVSAGVDTRLRPEDAYVIGKARTVSPERARSTVVVALEDAADTYRADPRYREIASYDPLTPTERDEDRTLRAEVNAALAGGAAAFNEWSAAHPGAAARLSKLDAPGPRIGLFLRVEQ